MDGVYTEAATWQMLVLQTGSMTSGDLGSLNETAQAVRVMKEKYIQWQQRLDALIAQVQTLKLLLSLNCHCLLSACHSSRVCRPRCLLIPVPAAMLLPCINARGHCMRVTH